MAADLSHQTEAIPGMLELLDQSDVDMVICSRYTAKGRVDSAWPVYCKLISLLATFIIKPLLPCQIKDPLSGFIAIKKECYAVNGELWNPIGAKLGLEIIVKSRVHRIAETPRFFEQRKFGQSKLINMKFAFYYAKQIFSLVGGLNFLLFSAEEFLLNAGVIFFLLVP